MSTAELKRASHGWVRGQVRAQTSPFATFPATTRILPADPPTASEEPESMYHVHDRACRAYWQESLSPIVGLWSCRTQPLPGGRASAEPYSPTNSCCIKRHKSPDQQIGVIRLNNGRSHPLTLQGLHCSCQRSRTATRSVENNHPTHYPL